MPQEYYEVIVRLEIVVSVRAKSESSATAKTFKQLEALLPDISAIGPSIEIIQIDTTVGTK